MKNGTLVELIENLGGVPRGTKGAIQTTRNGIVVVRWIWPAGTYLKNKPDTDGLPEEVFKKLFKKA